MRRGFLGPLGDDFPSIFPIAIGLMFFFGAIAIAYDTYSYKADQATLMRANIMVSRAVRQYGVMDSASWEKVCPLITDIQANYGSHAALMLVRPHFKSERDLSDTSIDDPISLHKPYLFKDGTQAFCPESSKRFDKWSEDEEIPFDDPSRPVLTFIYPVVVEMESLGNNYVPCEGSECFIKPAVLVVYTWK